MNVAQELVGRIAADYQAGKLPLPSLPDIALRVRKAVEDESRGTEQLSRLIQFDPALTARVIQAANSARFAGSGPVTTCRAAITRLGLRAVRDLVLTFAASSTYKTRSLRLVGRMKQLWLHSVQVAAISRVLGGIGPGLDPDRALLAGLVSGIGALPVFVYAERMTALAEDDQLFDQVVSKLKGKLGLLVLKSWGFDDDLLRVPLESEHWTRDPEAMPDYADVVMLAKVFSGFGSRQRLYHPPPITELPAFHKFPLGALGPEGSVELLEEAAEEINRVKRMLMG